MTAFGVESQKTFSSETLGRLEIGMRLYVDCRSIPGEAYSYANITDPPYLWISKMSSVRNILVISNVRNVSTISNNTRPLENSAKHVDHKAVNNPAQRYSSEV